MRDIGAGLDVGRASATARAKSTRPPRTLRALQETGRAARPRAARDGRLAPVRQRPAPGTAHRHGRSHRRVAQERRGSRQDVGSGRDRARAPRAAREVAGSRRGAAQFGAAAVGSLPHRDRFHPQPLRGATSRRCARSATRTSQKKAALVEEAEALADVDRLGARPRRGSRNCRRSGSRLGPVAARRRPRSGAAVPHGLQHVLRAPPRGSDRRARRCGPTTSRRRKRCARAPKRSPNRPSGTPRRPK